MKTLLIFCMLLLLTGEAATDAYSPLLDDRYSAFANDPLVTGTQLTAGVITNDRDSFRLGEYSGLRQNDVYALGALFSAGNLGDSELTYSVEGQDLGLDSRSIQGRLGLARGIRVDIAYRELPHFVQDSVFSPFRETGDNRWLLPDNWVGAGNVSGLSALDSALVEEDTHTKRRQLEFNLLLPINARLSLSADYRLVDIAGRRLTGTLFGVGGTQMGVTIPAEIDRQIQDTGVSISYNGSRGSLNAGFRYSDLREDSEPLTVQNPFIRTAFADQANYPVGFGRIAPPPDNSARSLYVKGLLRIGRTARLSLDLQRAWQEQDENFLPYTVNAGLDTPLSLPATDLGGERVVSLANLALALRPTAHTDLAIRYRFHDRDDRTDRLPFAFVLNDIRDQGIDPATGEIRVNRPYSRTTRQFALEGGYRFSGGWRLSAGLDRETVQRELLPVDETVENSAHLKLGYRFGAGFSGWLKWLRADRDAGNYIHNAAFLAGHTAAFIDANGTGVFANDPAMRQFFIADRRRDRADWVLNWATGSAFGAAFKFRRTEDDYRESRFGLTRVTGQDLTLDISYNPGASISLFGYFSRARQERAQGGYQWAGSSPQTTLQPLRDNGANGWRVESDALSDTVGAGMEWTVNGRLALEFEYALTLSETDYDIFPGSALSAASLPDLTMDWRDLTARARYRLSPRTSLALQYRFRDYSTRDFAVDGVAVDSDPSVLLSGARSADFQGNTLILSVTHDFQ